MKTRMPIPVLPILIIVAGALVAFAGQATSPSMTKPGTWRALFDGKSLAGWRGFHQQQPGKGWVAENGTIHLIPRKEGSAGEPNGDLITVDQFENFEFEIEWKLSKGGNSGIKYLVSEDLPKTGRSGVSFEYQVLDDENHPDAKMGIVGTRTVGGLYDLKAPSANKKVKPVGEFNLTRIVKLGPHIQHWLNGEKILEFEQGSDDLKARIAASKFKTTAGFGEAKRGHILLQDHSDGVWFRNIRIREL